MSGDTGLDPQASQRLHDRRQHAIRDLEELSEQTADEELDEATAERLRAGYQAELEAVNAELGVVDDMPGQPTGELDEALEKVGREPPPPSDREPTPEGRSSGRTIAGGFLLIGAFTAVILIAAQTFRSDGDAVSMAPSDVAGAIPLLEEVLALPDPPDAIRVAVEVATEDARSVLEAP